MKFLREGRWSREVQESVVGGGRWMTVPRFAIDPPVPGSCGRELKSERLLLNNRNEYGIDKEAIRIITKSIRLMGI